jgi:RNA polymerase sigma-70 factor (ECF subfamily)
MRQTEFDEPEFLARLRQGEEQAYRSLIRRFHFALVGVAASIIGSRAQAEEVVQDAWLAVFAGIGRFEGRSSLVTWVFSIVLNRARTRASREGRLVGLPALMDGTDPGGRAVDAGEFKPDGHWLEVPSLWDELSPERIVGGRQLWDHVTEAIERLPAGQRAVIILRDMEGREAEEACTLLGISAENQRVLLHRARGRIRQTIDALIGESRSVPASAPARRQSRSGTATLGRLAVWARTSLRRLLPVPAWQSCVFLWTSQIAKWWYHRQGDDPRLEGNMAPRKAKPAPAVQKAPAAASGTRTTRQDAASATGGSDSNRLLREAAWSRMFGRIEAKNPFAR